MTVDINIVQSLLMYCCPYKGIMAHLNPLNKTTAIIKYCRKQNISTHVRNNYFSIVPAPLCIHYANHVHIATGEVCTGPCSVT